MTLFPSAAELAPFLPEVIVICAIALVLLVPIFSPKKNSAAVAFAAGLGLLLAIVALLRIDPAAITAPLFGGLLLIDPFAWFLKLIILIFTFFVLMLWAFATRDSFAPGDAPEFFTLLLSATLGMMLMVSTTNLLMMFLAIETASLPSYVLAGFRKTHKLGAEAALKYVLFGAVSAAIMLYGMSMLYGYFATLDLAQIAAQLHNPASPFAFSGQLTGSNHAIPYASAIFYLGFPIMAILIGVGFKVAMFPVHFWCPDVFEGTHIDITTFLSVASKGAGIGLFLRIILTLVGTHGAVAANLQWLVIGVTVVAAATCFVGNLGALVQTNIKRLLAFSSIAHAGYILLAVAALMVPESSTSARPAQAAIFYLFGYLFMNAGAFSAAAAISQKIGSEDIRDYAGLGRRAPILAFCMAIFVFSLTGIPLTVGFSVKLKLFQVLFDATSPLAYFALTVLAVNTVIAAFYYFRILKAMYLTTSDKEPAAGWLPTTALAVAMVVPNIGLFVAYNWLDDQSHAFAHLQAPAMIQPTHAAAPAAVAPPLP